MQTDRTKNILTFKMKADDTFDEDVIRSQIFESLPKEKVDQFINACKNQGKYKPF